MNVALYLLLVDAEGNTGAVLHSKQKKVQMITKACAGKDRRNRKYSLGEVT